MSILNIRNLPQTVHQALRERAARNGRSMEAEAREILTSVCEPKQVVSGAQLQAFVLSSYDGKLPNNVVETFLAEKNEDWAGE